MSKRFVLFLLTGLLSVFLGFVTLTPMQAVTAVRDYGFWFMVVSWAGLVIHLVRPLVGIWRARGSAGGTGWREFRPALLVVVLGAVFLHVHEEHGFKIVSDEYVLSSTAKQMHEERVAAMTLRAYDYGGNFITLNSRVDKRPLAFPFLLAMLHGLTGYRVENVFVLNGLLSLVLTALLFVLGRRIGGFWAGVSAVAWICIVPLVVQNASGAGFELLNLVMILLTLWLGMRYVEAPADSDRLGALVFAAILLAQVRYESALFVLPTGVVILFGWWRARQVVLPPSLLLAPLLLLPVPWVQNVFKLSEASWQLRDVEGADVPFGLHYLQDNLGHALNFFLAFDHYQPTSWMLAVLGVPACGFVGVLIYRRGRAYAAERPAEGAFVIWWLGLLLHAFLMLCYFWGKWDDPIIRRLSLPTHLLLLFAVLWVWAAVPALARRWWALLGLAMVQWLGWSAPTLARQQYNAENFAARSANWMSDLAATQKELGRKLLVIDPAADLMWFLHNQSSLNPYTLAQRVDQFCFHFDRGTFDDVYLVQRVIVDLATGAREVSIDHLYGGAFTLEPAWERRFAPTYVIRISRIVAVDREKLEVWAEDYGAGRGHDPTAPQAHFPQPTAEEREALDEWVRQLP